MRLMATAIMQTDPKCIFCSIVAHTSPAGIVFEDERFIAINDIRPEAPTHVLVMPKAHIEKFTDIDEESQEAKALLTTCKRVAIQLGVENACKFSINNGKAAGQIVPHVHVHILSHIEAKK